PTTVRFTDPDVLPLATATFVIVDATPFTWTVDSGTLPPGLSLSSAGAITGTPTAAGTFTFTLRLVDSTGLTATQAKTITIAPENCTQPPIPPEPPTPLSNVRVMKRWVGTPSTTTIFVDQDGRAPFDAAVRADSEGDATHFAYPLSTRVTVGEVQVPPRYTATINCGGGRQPYTGGPFSVESPAVAGRTRLCTIVNTAPEPMVIVDKRPNKRTVRAGENVDFVITVRNAGRTPARNVRVCDRFPSGLLFVRAQGVRFQRGDACWTIRQLAPGRTWRVTVSMEAVRVSQRVALQNVVIVTDPNGRAVCASPRAPAAAGQRRGARIAICPAGVAVLPAAARGGGVTG
ncbi:MAG TPA: putative Ig domain-containing protein, partial [Acidimicrobiales bacterium]